MNTIASKDGTEIYFKDWGNVKAFSATDFAEDLKNSMFQFSCFMAKTIRAAPALRTLMSTCNNMEIRHV